MSDDAHSNVESTETDMAKKTIIVECARRPGVATLAAKLQRENPSWSADQATAEAKRHIVEQHSTREKDHVATR